MKFLLTSSGITNKSIAKAVLDLTGLKPDQIRLAFILTASNLESGDKGWLIDDLVHFKEQGYDSIDIVDIASIPKDAWLSRLESANVFCFGGGNEQYLAKIMKDSGLAEILPELLKDRLYIGISAGSMVTGKFLSADLLQIVYPEDDFNDKLEAPLGFVDFNFLPHLNSEHFPQVRENILNSIKDKFSSPVYALDDQSALKVADGKVEVVTEGNYLHYK